MPNSEGTNRPSDHKIDKTKKNGNQGDQKTRFDLAQKRKLEQDQQVRETNQSQHSDAGKPADPYNLAGHFANMLEKTGDLTPKISQQLESVTRKLEHEHKPEVDGEKRVDATKPQRLSKEEQIMRDRRATSPTRLIEDYAQKLETSLGNMLKNPFLR